MCVRSNEQGASQGQVAGRKWKQVAVTDIVVLSEGLSEEEELVARAAVPKRLVAVGLKPIVVSEETRAHAMAPDLWWDRKLDPGPDDYFMSLAWWVSSMEMWQQDQRELWWRVVELEQGERVKELEKEVKRLQERVAELEKKRKGKGKEKENAEE